jgi:hypothetical protein
MEEAASTDATTGRFARFMVSPSCIFIVEPETLTSSRRLTQAFAATLKSPF